MTEIVHFYSREAFQTIMCLNVVSVLTFKQILSKKKMVKIAVVITLSFTLEMEGIAL